MSSIIRCEGVSKRFRLPQIEHHTLRGRILHPLSRPSYREFQALEDVSFEVQRGEFFGIIGRNGSGKSTLLKIIAGIYRPDSGSVQVKGSLASFIELGVGFNQELSGHDNLIINGALLGLSRREIRYRMDEIVDFAELDGFMDVKLRNFSSGMQVRLAFSIALQADVDVLLTDEVLAVGDARFQEKCYEVFRQRKEQGRTIIFVSHDMSAVQQFSDRAMLLDEGAVVDIGETHGIARHYLQVNKIDPDRQKDALVVAPTGAGQSAKVSATWMEDDHGERTYEVGRDETIRIFVKVHAIEDDDRAVVGLSIQDHHGQFIFMTNSLLAGCDLGTVRGGEDATVCFEFPNLLSHGSYTVGVSVAPRIGDGTGPITDLHDEAWQFQSLTPRTNHGIVELPVVATVRAGDATTTTSS